MQKGADRRQRQRDDTAPQTYRAHVTAKAEELTDVRHEVRAWAEQHGADRTTADAVELACYEAMANVVLHAYGDGDGSLEVSATSYPDRIQLVVSDDGRWRVPSGQAHPDGGMGLDLISQLAHRADVDARHGGTVVSMTWFRHGVDQPAEPVVDGEVQ